MSSACQEANLKVYLFCSSSILRVFDGPRSYLATIKLRIYTGLYTIRRAASDDMVVDRMFSSSGCVVYICICDESDKVVESKKTTEKNKRNVGRVNIGRRASFISDVIGE